MPASLSHPTGAPRTTGGMIAVLSLALGFAALSVIGLAASSQPASAQQSFGNFFTYQPKQRKRVVRKKRAPDAETATAPDAAAAQKPATSRSRGSENGRTRWTGSLADSSWL